MSSRRPENGPDLGSAWNPITEQFEEWNPENSDKAFEKFAAPDKVLAWAYVKWDQLKEPITIQETAEATKEDRRTIQNWINTFSKRQSIMQIPAISQKARMERRYKITRKGAMLLACRHIQYEVEKLVGHYEEDPLKTQQNVGFVRGVLQNFHSMLLEEGGSLIGEMETRLAKVRPDGRLARRMTKFSSDPLGWVDSNRSPDKRRQESRKYRVPGKD
jgi:hypothetical protein